MCCGTNIFINGARINNCCCGPGIGIVPYSAFSPGCFGYGFSAAPMGNCALMGAGIGLGFAAGMALPGIIKGIGSACKWGWNNLIVPAGRFIGQGATWLWNNALKPAWNGIKSAVSWVGNGVKNLWNKIFKKGD